MQMEEQILAEGCRKGDDMARKELYDRYAGRLLSICMRYAGDRATAYRGTGSLRAWIERITVNVALEWIRSRSKLGSVTLDEGKAAAEVAEPDVAEMARVPREVLMRFIGELPEGYRAVFNLYCIEEYSHRDIARMLGINEKSSSSQLFRARAMLARRIRAYLETH